jgi:HEPN domain-containing protein
MEKKDYIEYWKSTAEKDWEAVGHLFEKGDYLHALFFAHLVLEKLLKAHHVKSAAIQTC